MKLNEITRKQTQEFIKANSEYKHYNPATLADIHTATGGDIQNAKFYTLDGSWTYGQLEKNGIEYAFILATGVENRWYNSGAWISNGGTISLIDSRWLNLRTCSRKGDCEDIRKKYNETALIIAFNEPITAKDWHAWKNSQYRKEPTAHDELMTRLRAFKHQNDVNKLTTFKGFQKDIENIKKLRDHYFQLIAENVRKYNGADLVKYCARVESFETYLKWFNEYAEDVQNIANGTQVDDWQKVETMSQYKKLIGNIDRHYITMINKVAEI